MLKFKIVLSLLILFLLGGCNGLGQKDISEMDPAELPDVIAFQDDFTREFMSSLEEVEDGYYLFESKTGGYTMMYPENAKNDQSYFEVIEDSYETIRFGENQDSNKFHYNVRATYDLGENTREPERLLNLLSDTINYDGDYEKNSYEDKTVYFANTEYTTRSGEGTTYRYFGLVKSNKSDQTVRYMYNVFTNNDNNIDLNLSDIEKEVMKLAQSIEFK